MEMGDLGRWNSILERFRVQREWGFTPAKEEEAVEG